MLLGTCVQLLSILDVPSRYQWFGVHFPAPGPFNHLQLEWTETVSVRAGKRVKCQTAKVPSFRISDFVHGEEGLNDCKWISSNVKRQTLEDLRGKRITSRTALLREHRHCHFGPEDLRRTAEQLLNPPPKRSGGRRSKRAMGEAIRKGCQAHFRLVEYADQPGIIEKKITYYMTQHVDRNGQPCHEEGTVHATRKRKHSSVQLPAIGDSSRTAINQTCAMGHVSQCTIRSAPH